MPRRAMLTLGATSLFSPLVNAQVEVGRSSRMRGLVSAEDLEQAARQQYGEVIAKAKAEGKLAGVRDSHFRRVHGIAQGLVAQATPWNPRAAQWQWEVNVIRSSEVNAWCMPGGKIAIYTGIIDRLRLTDDEVAMIMGHEMAHALREHAREQMGKQAAMGAGVSLLSSLFGLGEVGSAVASLGGQLLALKFSRNDETEADLVGLDMAARTGHAPQASISLWNKMMAGGAGQGGFLSTHPSGPDRIRQLQANLGKVQGLYEKSRGARARASLPQGAVGTSASGGTAGEGMQGRSPGAFQRPIGSILPGQ